MPTGQRTPHTHGDTLNESKPSGRLAGTERQGDSPESRRCQVRGLLGHAARIALIRKRDQVNGAAFLLRLRWLESRRSPLGEVRRRGGIGVRAMTDSERPDPSEAFNPNNPLVHRWRHEDDQEYAAHCKCCKVRQKHEWTDCLGLHRVEVYCKPLLDADVT